MLQFIILTLKGVAMGIANVIPGVSGGTIALITNIYQEFIDTLKNFNTKALRLLLGLKFIELSKHLNSRFLIPIVTGIVLSILSLAKLFDFLLINYPSQTWGYFFGLVLASIFPIFKKIQRLNVSAALFLVLGIAIATALSLFSPTAVENTSYLYILLCGAVGVCGMILPGLSGSYILMLMGNYHLLMVKSINSFSDLINALFDGQVGNFLSGPQLDLLIYFILFLIGSVAGIILFSNIIAWIFKRYNDQTLSLLTGFVLGSLSIIWPWKKEIFDLTTLDRNGQAILIGYERFFPKVWTQSDIAVVLIIVLGIVSIITVEYFSVKKT
ncbi:MAG: DUF368 domain-containing protein [Bacteroidota bacterium]|nr:DUF368 domain-containing protein [Bacteroidota bacterium]